MAADPLLARLLDLYPLGQLRAAYVGPPGKLAPVTTKAGLIAEIAEGISIEEAAQFAAVHHATTKHHVHLRTFAKALTLKSLPDNPLGLPGLKVRDEGKSYRSWFYLLELDYDVVLREPLAQEQLTFLWPVRVLCSREHLELRYTIMEKNLSARYPGRFVKAEKDLDEDAVEDMATQGLGLDETQAEDLNKGVKVLWAEDLIDAPKVQWKKALATTRQVMDAEYLVKRDDPVMYDDIQDKPLFATLFKWMGGNIGLEHFTVDPTGGMLTFSTYSDLDAGAEHVVREIRRRNG